MRIQKYLSFPMRTCPKHFVPMTLPGHSATWLVCALLWGGVAMAGESADPFSTGATLPPKPALRNAEPCADLPADRALDLADVVNVALCNNPQTREVWASSRAQAAQVGVSQASYLPGVSASASENRSTPGASQRSIGLSLSYLLYDFGARAANLDYARQLLAAASATQDSAVQALFLAVVQAYYQTHATQAAFEAASVSEHAAQESFAAAKARYQAGSATPADKFAAQTAYSQATLNRITADGAMKIARGNLANILSLDANQQVNLVANLPASHENEISGNFEQNIAVLIEQARQHRPDLQAAAALVKAAESSTEAARAAGKPTVSLVAATSQNNSAGINTHGSSLGVSLSVPLFSGYAPTYRIRAAEAQTEIRQAQFERIRLQVALDVWTAYQNLITATQNRITTADLLSSAEQSERVALGRYKAGAGIMLDVLNAQNALASARQQRIQASFNWNISRAALAQAMGSLDADFLQVLPARTSGKNVRNTHKP